MPAISVSCSKSQELQNKSHDEIRRHLQKQLSFREERLFGREVEQSALNNSYYSSLTLNSNSPPSALLISGESGMGKTKLAELLRTMIKGDDGIFIRGKFDDQLSPGSALPYSGLASAFGEYCTLLEQMGQDEWNEVTKKLKKEISVDEGKLLVEAIPSLKKVITAGLGDAVKPLTSAGAQTYDFKDTGSVGDVTIADGRFHRLNYVLKKFISVISSTGDPIIFLIDDMQVSLLLSDE